MLSYTYTLCFFSGFKKKKFTTQKKLMREDSAYEWRIWRLQTQTHRVFVKREKREKREKR